LAVRDRLPDVEGGAARVSEESQAMTTSRLSAGIVERLRKETRAWDRARISESEREVAARLDEAEVFTVNRPAREPLSVRLDPQDVFLLKRLARRLGIPPSQLLGIWIHERVVREAKRRAG
jgi:hypothetical protein